MKPILNYSVVIGIAAIVACTSEPIGLLKANAIIIDNPRNINKQVIRELSEYDADNYIFFYKDKGAFTGMSAWQVYGYNGMYFTKTITAAKPFEKIIIPINCILTPVNPDCGK